MRFPSLSRKLVPLLVAAGLVLAACGGGATGGGQTGGPKQGGQLTVAFNIEPDTFDPQAQTTTAVGAMVNNMVERLVQYDKAGHIVPDLATSWKMSGDGLSYTFTLRKGVKFHDGTPFTADAVKFSLDRLLSPTTFKAQPGTLEVIKDTQVIDDTHVKVDLKSPFAPFVGALTATSAGITSPQAVNQQGNTPATIVHPVGTGPYELAQYAKGDHILMKRFDGYWGKKPAYASQLYKILPEAASRESLVKAGQADVAFQPPPNDLAGLRNDSDLSVLMLPSDRSIFISIDTKSTRVPQLQDKRVRQAMNYAIDRDAMIKNLTFGTTQKMTAPIAPGVFGYCKVGSYDYNPSKAKQLLQQAGATGVSLTMRSPQGRYTADYEAAQAVAGDLRAVGFKVNLANPPDWRTYLGLVNVPPSQAKQDIHLLGWAPGFLDASQQMLQFDATQVPPAGLATSYYSDPEVQKLITGALSESDKSKRQKDYCAAEKIIWDDAPWIFLWIQSNPTLTTKKVKNVYGLPNEQIVTMWAEPA